MDFNTIEIEDDLDELSAEEATELLAKFQEAQEANREQFEEVTETVQEFSALDEEVSEDLVEASPLSESEVSGLDFSRKRELLADFSTEETSEEVDEGEEGETTPAKFGKQGETHPEGEEPEDGTPDVVKAAFSDINGVEL